MTIRRPDRADVASVPVDDPPPVVDGDGVLVGPEGGEVWLDHVTVSVPVGVVVDGDAIRVLPVRPLGERLGEIFGTPVGVEHAAPLTGPLTVRWDASALTPEQRETAVLARWDEQRRVWTLGGVEPTIDGSDLVAQIQGFSFWTWVANVRQSLTEVVGQAMPAPGATVARCTPGSGVWSIPMRMSLPPRSGSASSPTGTRSSPRGSPTTDPSRSA